MSGGANEGGKRVLCLPPFLSPSQPGIRKGPVAAVAIAATTAAKETPLPGRSGFVRSG